MARENDDVRDEETQATPQAASLLQTAYWQPKPGAPGEQVIRLSGWGRKRVKVTAAEYEELPVEDRATSTSKTGAVTYYRIMDDPRLNGVSLSQVAGKQAALATFYSTGDLNVGMAKVEMAQATATVNLLRTLRERLKGQKDVYVPVAKAKVKSEGYEVTRKVG